MPPAYRRGAESLTTGSVTLNEALDAYARVLNEISVSLKFGEGPPHEPTEVTATWLTALVRGSDQRVREGRVIYGGDKGRVDASRHLPARWTGGPPRLRRG